MQQTNKVKEDNVELANKIFVCTKNERDLVAKQRISQSQLIVVEKALQKERNEFNVIRIELESKLSDVQTLMMEKLSAANADKDQRVSLANEIEAMKSLLHLEEKRLQMAVVSSKPSIQTNKLADFLQMNTEAKVASITKSPDHLSSEDMKRRSSEDIDMISGDKSAMKGSMGRRPTEAVFDALNTLTKGPSAQSNIYKSKITESPNEDAKHGIRSSSASGSRSSDTCGGDGKVVTSAIGSVTFTEFSADGSAIRVLNTDASNEVDVGGWYVQVNFGKVAVAVCRLAAFTKIPSTSMLTVWSGGTKNPAKHHSPPTDFVFNEIDLWPSGPSYTILLCKPTGEAMATLSCRHRKTKDAFDNRSKSAFTRSSSSSNSSKPMLSPTLRNSQKKVPHKRLPVVSPDKINRDPKLDQTMSFTMKSHGATLNPGPEVVYRVGERGPSCFEKPHDRFDQGVMQVNSMYNNAYNPPRLAANQVKPLPLFSQW